MSNFNLEIPGKFRSVTRGNVDWYYGGGNIAWPSLADAFLGIPTKIRPGKIIGIITGSGDIEEYYWDSVNLGDGDIILKSIDIDNLAKLDSSNQFTSSNIFFNGIVTTSPGADNIINNNTVHNGVLTVSGDLNSNGVTNLSGIINASGSLLMSGIAEYDSSVTNADIDNASDKVFISKEWFNSNNISSGSFVSKLGDNMTGELIIDPLDPSSSNISGSFLTIKRTGAASNLNIGQFIDLNITDGGSRSSYGEVIRVVNNSTNPITDGIIGLNTIARHSGSEDIGFIYSHLSESEYIGGGDVNFIVPSPSTLKINGTGSGTINFARASNNSVIVDNPNIIVNNLQGGHPNITLNNGTVGEAIGTVIDIDYNPSGNSTVTGDLMYLRIQNDLLPPVAGNSYSIRSFALLPSEFDGVIRTNIDLAILESESPKTLITKEFLEDKRPKYNFAILVEGPLSSIPEVGNLNKPFDDINEIFSYLNTNTEYEEIGFEIIIKSGTSFNLINPNINKVYKNLTIKSELDVELILENSFRVQNFNLNTKGSLKYLNPGGLQISGNLDINVNLIEYLLGSTTSNYTPNALDGLSQPTTGIFEINFKVNEFIFNKDTGSSSILTLGGYDIINLYINKLVYIKTISNSIFSIGAAPLSGRLSTYNINIGEIDITQVTNTGTIVLFQGLGLNHTLMNSNNYNSKYGGTYNLSVGDITGGTSNPTSFRILSGINSGIINLNLNTRSDLPQLIAYIHPTYITDMELTISGYLESRTNGFPLINTYEITSLDPSKYDSCFIKIKDFDVNFLSGGTLLKTRSYEFIQFGNPSVPIPVVIENINLKTSLNRSIDIDGSNTTDSPLPLESPLIRFNGVNRFLMSGTSEYLIQIPFDDINLPSGKYLINHGKILHNSINTDYTDFRKIEKKEDIYTNEL